MTEYKENNAGDDLELKFTPEAQELMNKIPFFLKNLALVKLKEFAEAEGIREITADVLLEARKKILDI